MLTIINTVAARAGVVMPGIDKGRLLTGHDYPKPSPVFLRASAGEVVIKLGAAGALAQTSARSDRSLRGPSLSRRSTPSARVTGSRPAISPAC